MKSKVEEAIELFKKGYLCSQAIYSEYGPMFGISREDALKVGTSFGGGMARLQEVCGAVTGAFMVIGAKNGATDPDDVASVGRTYQSVRKFANRFKELHGTILCRELLGIDLNSDEGQKQLKEKDLKNKICVKCIRDAATILETSVL